MMHETMPPEALAPIFMFGIFGCVGLFSLLMLAFWIWMLVDCAMNEPSEGNDKVVWILIIVLLSWLGALIYFFARRSNRPPRSRL